MRKLASIQTENTVEPIPNADAIERIRVLGWWVVAKKGEHKPGDKVVYCEIDSLLPERPEFEFLRASSFKPAQIDATGVTVLPAGFRIKTVKLRGQVSQGICFPLSILPPGSQDAEGADVTDLLGVVKWEPPLPLGMVGKVKGPFPGFLPKTDETRVQVLEDALRRHQRKSFYVTEKLDGTSFTAFLRNGEFGICSRNLLMDEADDSNILARVAKNLKLPEKLRAVRGKLEHDIAIQADVIAVVFDLQPQNVRDTRRSSGRILEFRLEIDVLRVVAGSVGIGDIGGHQLLPGAEQIHISLEAVG